MQTYCDAHVWSHPKSLVNECGMDTTAEEGTSDQGAQPGESANLDHQQ